MVRVSRNMKYFYVNIGRNELTTQYPQNIHKPNNYPHFSILSILVDLDTPGPRRSKAKVYKENCVEDCAVDKWCIIWARHAKARAGQG